MLVWGISMLSRSHELAQNFNQEKAPLVPCCLSATAAKPTPKEEKYYKYRHNYF